MEIAIISLLAAIFVINVILILRMYKNNTEDHIISELKINLGQNNLNIIDAVTKKYHNQSRIS